MVPKRLLGSDLNEERKTTECQGGFTGVPREDDQCHIGAVFLRKALDKMLATASTTRFTLLDKHSEGVTGILSCSKSNQCTLGDRSGEGMSAAAFREITK